MGNMQAMIFAAGLGTRLKPLTDTMPKALVPVDGKPLIKHVISRLKCAGASRVVVNVHHFADSIIEYLNANGNFGIDIRVSDERGQLLETGGGIKKASAFFDADKPVLIHNVDILSNINLHKFYQEADDSQADAMLLVSGRSTKRYLLFDEGMRLAAWTNVSTGEVKSPNEQLAKEIAEAYSAPDVMQRDGMTAATLATTAFGAYPSLRKYAFSGIHVFSPRLFPLMDGWPEKFPIMDFYLKNCASANIKGYALEGLRLMDVGKIDTLDDAEAFVRSLDETTII